MVLVAHLGLPLTAMAVTISFDVNLRERRYSVIGEHPDTDIITWKKTLVVSGNSLRTT